MLVLFILERNTDKLCKPIHKLGYTVTEELAYLINVCLIRAVLDSIVQERSADGICIEPQPRNYFRYGNGMIYIFLVRNIT